MRGICSFIGIFVSVAFFVSQPSWEHFVWPINVCLLADLCNHTWITECGVENGTKIERKFFIDECDMLEFNCDKNRNFELTNFSSCLPDVCRSWTTSQYNRMGNYRVFRRGEMEFAPTQPYWDHKHHSHQTDPFIFPTSTRPLLPAHMFHGKRRYSPHFRGRKSTRWHLHSTRPLKSKQTRKQKKKFNTNPRKIQNNAKTVKKQYKAKSRKIQTTTKRPTVVLRTIKVIKNGISMIKILKGFAPTKKKGEDSDFLQ